MGPYRRYSLCCYCVRDDGICFVQQLYFAISRSTFEQKCRSGLGVHSHTWYMYTCMHRCRRICESPEIPAYRKKNKPQRRGVMPNFGWRHVSQQNAMSSLALCIEGIKKYQGCGHTMQVIKYVGVLKYYWCTTPV
jgi:hypothetical protein